MVFNIEGHHLLTSIHRARGDGVNTDPARLKFLGHTAGEVLDRCFGACVRGVEAGEGSEKSRNDGNDLTTIFNVPGSCFENKEGTLGVDSATNMLNNLLDYHFWKGTPRQRSGYSRKHAVVLGLRNFRDGLLQDLADSVDDHVNLPEVFLDRIEESVNRCLGGEVALVKLDHSLRELLAQLLLQLGGIVL